ncbi:MAG: hypothetical protein WA790_15125 [Sulfitobacter sp.]
MSDAVDWSADKTLIISSAAVVVLHDMIEEMAKQGYQNVPAMTKAQEYAFDELCAACEPKNDVVFANNYDQLLRSAEDHLNRRFEE